MSVASRKRLLEELKNKKFRDAYAAEHVKTSLPIQIYTLREQRGLSQSQLAERAKTTQAVISRLEDPDYGKFTIASLLKMASALDVALLVKFVPFTRLLNEFEDVSPAALAAPEFAEELPKLVAWANEDAKNKSTDSEVSDSIAAELSGRSPEGQKWSELQSLLYRSNRDRHEAIQGTPSTWVIRSVTTLTRTITSVRGFSPEGINPKSINLSALIAHRSEATTH